MHGKATEPQIFVGTDWVANVSVRGVGLFVSETIDRHREKFHTVLKILIHDGYDLLVDAMGDGIIRMRGTAGSDACSDCLVPKQVAIDVIKSFLKDMPEVREIDLTYPTPSAS